MAYMKTGRVREVRTRTKVAVAVILAVVLLALACVLFAVKNPRDAMQLVLSDQDYASYVLLKNAKDRGETARPYLDRLTENTAYDGEGKVSVELSKDMQTLVGSSEVLETAQKYVEKLSFTSNTQMRGLQFSNELKFNDNRQTIFTHDLAYLSGGVYSTVPEYGYGWTRLLDNQAAKTEAEQRQQRVLQAVLASDNETIRKALSKSAKAGYKSVKKDLEVTIDEDQTLDFQDKHASGDRVNILLGREDAQQFLTTFFDKLKKTGGLKDAVNEALDTDDRFGSDESFQTFLNSLEQQYRDEFRDTGISNVSVDLLVDRQNVIHALDALVKRSDGDLILNAMLDDDDHRGPALHLRSGGDTLVKFNVEKTSDTSGSVDFALGNFENQMVYSNFSTANGMVYGTFEFAPTKVTWSEDLGTFGLHLQMTPNVASDGSVSGFHLLAQTGFSTLGTANIEADFRDAKYTGMVTEDDIVFHSEYTDEQKKARRIQYWLAELPESDPQYNAALKRIVQTIVNNVVEAASATATDKNASETLNAGA